MYIYVCICMDVGCDARTGCVYLCLHAYMCMYMQINVDKCRYMQIHVDMYAARQSQHLLAHPPASRPLQHRGAAQARQSPPPHPRSLRPRTILPAWAFGCACNGYPRPRTMPAAAFRCGWLRHRRRRCGSMQRRYRPLLMGAPREAPWLL